MKRRLTESQLRQIVRSQIRALVEAPVSPDAGQPSQAVEGARDKVVNALKAAFSGAGMSNIAGKAEKIYDLVAEQGVEAGLNDIAADLRSDSQLAPFLIQLGLSQLGLGSADQSKSTSLRSAINMLNQISKKEQKK